MLLDKDGNVLTSKRIQAVRKRIMVTPSAINAKTNVTCDAQRIDPVNFLLPGDRCCYCGLPQDLHR